jgi:hypothetical protein
MVLFIFGVVLVSGMMLKHPMSPESYTKLSGLIASLFDFFMITMMLLFNKDYVLFQRVE